MIARVTAKAVELVAEVTSDFWDQVNFRWVLDSGCSTCFYTIYLKLHRDLLNGCCSGAYCHAQYQTQESAKLIPGLRSISR